MKGQFVKRGKVMSLKYRVYGWVHKTTKKLLKRSDDLPRSVKLISIEDNGSGSVSLTNTGFVNETEIESDVVELSDVFPVENLVSAEAVGGSISFKRRSKSVDYAESLEEAESLWPFFIENSLIAKNYRNGGTHYAGYILECQEWCLPSWIWTNAALVRYYIRCGSVDEATKLGDIIIAHQEVCGGWIVRNDYSSHGIIPVLAPNDSCYIALNCCLELYEVLRDQKYLSAAERTGQWVMETARKDGLVYFGVDTKTGRWITNRNIVDVGFTGGLFAKLFEITKKEKYLEFLKRFVKAYVKVFYIPEKKCFATAIDSLDHQYGGAFGRGQAWALEGLIPAYRVLQEDYLKNVIESTIDTLLDKQLRNGGWSYNLAKPLMGEDSKAVSVIAKSMLEWYILDGNGNQKLVESAKNALNWCAKHTVRNTEGKGGIFSYTVEGAIAHHRYSNTAFVYGSSYALECMEILKRNFF